MKQLFKFCFFSFLMCFSSFLLAQEKSGEDSFNKILKTGVLKVCSQAGFIPFEMKDNKGKIFKIEHENNYILNFLA